MDNVLGHTERLGSIQYEQLSISGARWLLAQLSTCFKGSLKVVCKHKRYGSLLMHRDCDILKALSAALGRDSTRAQTSTRLTRQLPTTRIQWTSCRVWPHCSVTILGLSVCLSVCLSVGVYSRTTGYVAAHKLYKRLQRKNF